MTALAQPRWVVAQTQPLCERRASAHIERQGGEVFAPFFYERARPVRLFPGYLFVHIFGTSSWLHNTMGVLRVLCMGSHPCEIAPVEIEKYEVLADDKGVVILPGQADMFTPGQRVRIIEGPMLNQIGVVEGMDAQERVFVLLSMLGRQSRVSCPVALVTAV